MRVHYKTCNAAVCSQHFTIKIWDMASAESISSKIRNKTWMPSLTILFNTVLELLVILIGEEIKRVQIGKEEIKLFADDKILNMESSKTPSENYWSSTMNSVKL